MKRLPNESFTDYKKRRKQIQQLEKELLKPRVITPPKVTVAKPGTQEYKRIISDGKLGHNQMFLKHKFKEVEK